ncbi:Hypothetical protein FKW44_000916, partial [Caligus rogercresseyi]
ISIPLNAPYFPNNQTTYHNYNNHTLYNNHHNNNHNDSDLYHNPKTSKYSDKLLFP